MEEIYNNKYLTVFADTSQSMVVLDWQSATAYMTDDEFKEALLHVADLVQQKQITRWLANTKNFDYIIVPEVQQWTAEVLNQKLIEAGLKKMGVVIPETYFAQVSVQQTVDDMEKEQKVTTLSFAYFDQVDKAKNWLLE